MLSVVIAASIVALGAGYGSIPGMEDIPGATGAGRMGRPLRLKEKPRHCVPHKVDHVRSVHNFFGTWANGTTFLYKEKFAGKVVYAANVAYVGKISIPGEQEEIDPLAEQWAALVALQERYLQKADFQLLLFINNQFLVEYARPNNDNLPFNDTEYYSEVVEGGAWPSDLNLNLHEAVHVIGQKTHEVFAYFHEACRLIDTQDKRIADDFHQFVIDKNGRPVMHGGSGLPIPELYLYIDKLLQRNYRPPRQRRRGGNVEL